MKKKLMIMSLLVFLLTGLSASSFFLSDYLTKIINNNNHSVAQFNFALAQENIAALNLAWKHTTFHSEQWLKLAKILAKTQGEAAYQLAIYYQNQPTQAVFWYKSAIRLNYLNASISLAQLYFQQDELENAAEILTALPTSLPQQLANKVIMLKTNIAINQGKSTEIKRIIGTYGEQLTKTLSGRLLLTDIEKYQLLPTQAQLIAPSSSSLSCDNSIQLFATNLKHLKHLDGLIEKFLMQTLNGAVCFSPVRYIPINALDCSDEADQAIYCNELNWQPWASSISTRYVGLMLPQGGANVHLGILYFDAQDSVDVVAHEISHLLGFIDEYPLVTGHVKCHASQNEPFAQNISVLKKRYQGEQTTVRNTVLKQLAWAKHIKNSTPILQAITTATGKHYWQLGTPAEFKDEVGLFYAQTCDNSVYQAQDSFRAFKPLSHRTKLQYFALDFPQLYANLSQENASQYLMPSFHYNIALAYFKQDKLEQAHYWLEQAQNWEVDLDRRDKARQGRF